MNILPSSNSRIDFVLITALPEERDAVLAKLPAYHKLPPNNEDIRTYFQADLPITFPDSSSGKYRVVVMCLSGMGRVQSATATMDAIRQWHPRYVMLIGIAGGIAARNVQIGDILISDQIVDYELQKLTSVGPEIRWEVQRAEPRLLNACINYQNESWQELINVERPRRGTPNRHVGPIASGDKVIAFGKILTRYQDVWLKLLGVEMEAAGVATAAFQASERPGFFMVRGVSDFADEDKGSSHVVKWRSYACDAAASFAIALLKSGPVPLLGETVQNKTKQVQLIFEGEFSEFTSIHQQEIVSVLATLLRIEQSDIRVLKVQQGSILMTIEMLGTAADDFYEMVIAQAPRIMTLGIKSILLEDGRHFEFADKNVEILNNQPKQIRTMNTNLARIEAAQNYLGRELSTYEMICRMRRQPPVVQPDAGRYHFLSYFADVLQSYRDLEKRIVPQQEWFYFDDEGNHVPPARSLGELIDRLNTLDLTALTAHFQRGDFARWIRDVLQNKTLASQLESLNTQQLSGEGLRRALLEALELEICIAAGITDPEIVHGLALLHWEWALEFDEDNKGGDSSGKDSFELASYHYRWAKYYWSHLLGRKGYWQSFTQKYYKGAQTDAEETSTNLYREVYRTLLDHHYNRCRINFNSGKLDAAIFHLNCLCNWNVLKDPNSQGLYDKPLLNQHWDQAALEGVDNGASDILNRWMSEWLKHANETLDDTTVELPRGISKNYQDTLEVTRPYLELGAQHPQLFQRLLMFVLTQANSWCYETALANDYDAALAIMEGAGSVIRHMESFLDKPKINSIANPEQKALSTSYSLWAQLIIGNDVKRGQHYAEAAAAWDPGNQQAKDLRKEMDQVGVRVRMGQAQAYLQTEEFEKAVEVLQEIDLEKHSEAQKSVHSLLAVTHYQWAMHFANLANQETEALLNKKIFQKIEKTKQMIDAMTFLGEARDHMAEALKYEPGHPVLTENFEDLKEEAKYRPYSIKTKVGIECFEKGDYDNALAASEGKIPKDFPSYDTIIQIRAGSFFRRAIEHANRERFDAAVKDMQHAQALVPDNEVVREHLQELEKIRIDFPHLNAMKKAESLLEKEKYSEALKAMENIPNIFGGYERVQSLRAICEFRIGIQLANAGNLYEAIQHLERAAEYNPGESVIKQQLNALYEIRRRGGFEAIERHNRAVQKAQEVVEELNRANARNPLTPARGYQLLAILEEAVTDSDEDPQIVALRDQLQQALWGR